MLPHLSITFLIGIRLVFGQNDGCTCVSIYLCKNGTININGEGLIDISKKPAQCSSYLEICCKKENIIEAPATTVSSSTNKLQCGERHIKGIGYRILGGDNNEAQFGEFPWMAAVFHKKRTQKKYVYKCGGSLIHPQVVLTAAHCVDDHQNYQFKVRLGEWDTQTEQELFKHVERNVASLSIQNQYNSRDLRSDIALLFLREPVAVATTNHINPICLPPLGFVASGDECVVTGWGKENFENASKYQAILRKLELPIMNRSSCQSALRKTKLGRSFNLHESCMCAGGEEGTDACTGDGGGPLFCPIEGAEDRYYQVGIVSWGIGCGGRGIPGVYVDVAHFRRWIDRAMEQKNFEKSSYEYS